MFALRRIANAADALLPPPRGLLTTGAALRNPALRRQFATLELGAWSLTAATLNFLELEIQRLRPLLVLEFGSGISTACLARYMAELHGECNRVLLVTIEQSVSVIETTARLLHAAGLSKYVRVIHAPLRATVIEGQPVSCYDIPHDLLGATIEERRADFVLVDGPATEDLGRFGTLLEVRRFLSTGARFFLDDALRDGELKIADLWSRLSYLRVDGVYIRGKGLLVGEIVGNHAPNG